MKKMFQHTAARRRLAKISERRREELKVSTHSRPKAAGENNADTKVFIVVSTHSRPKAAGWEYLRRKLRFIVSTHSRPKAAGK